MNGIDIFRAVGEVDEKLIMECDRYKIRKYRSVMYIAACIAVCAVSAAVIAVNKNDIARVSVSETVILTGSEADTFIAERETAASDNTAYSDEMSTAASVSAPLIEAESTAVDIDTAGSPSVSDTFSDTSAADGEPADTDAEQEEIEIVPHWNETDESERYPYFIYNGAEYSMTNEYFSADETKFLFNDCIYGIDEYSGERYEKRVSVYKVMNADENCIVAVQIDESQYRGYVNFSYAPDTLGEYISGTDLAERFDADRLKIRTDELFDDETGRIYYTEYILQNKSELILKLFDENSLAPKETNYGMIDIVFSYDNRMLFSIRDRKYISFGSADYYIGEEAADRFIEELVSSAEQSVAYIDAASESEDIPE